MDHQYYYHEHLIRLFAPLVYKTLARCNIHSAHIHYDDYWQELRIKLLQIAQNFDGQPLTNDDDRYRFTAYAQRGLYWHLSLIHISEPTRREWLSRMPSSA